MAFLLPRQANEGLQQQLAGLQAEWGSMRRVQEAAVAGGAGRPCVYVCVRVRVWLVVVREGGGAGAQRRWPCAEWARHGQG